MTCLGKAGIMSIYCKSGEHGDVPSICHKFDRYLKMSLWHRIDNAVRELKKEMEQFPVAPTGNIEDVPAPSHESRYEKNEIILWDTAVQIDSDELAEILDRMPKRYRLIVELWWVEGRPDEEIGFLTGWGKDTTIKYRCDALRYLRDKLMRRHENGQE